VLFYFLLVCEHFAGVIFQVGTVYQGLKEMIKWEEMWAHRCFIVMSSSIVWVGLSHRLSLSTLTVCLQKHDLTICTHMHRQLHTHTLKTYVPQMLPVPKRQCTVKGRC